MVVLYLAHKNRFKTGQTMPKQAKQSEKEKPRKPHGFGVFELFWTEISACWTSRTWCCPCQTSGNPFSFHLIFGLILRFFCTSDSNFHSRAWRTKNRFCSLYVPCTSLPRATQDNRKERILVAVLVITSKSNSHTEDSIMEKYISDQYNDLWYELQGKYYIPFQS